MRRARNQLTGESRDPIRETTCKTRSTLGHDFNQPSEQWFRNIDLFKSMNQMAGGNRIHDAGEQRRALIALFSVFFEAMIGGSGDEPVKEFSDQLLKTVTAEGLMIGRNVGEGRFKQLRRFDLILFSAGADRGLHIIHQRTASPAL